MTRKNDQPDSLPAELTDDELASTEGGVTITNTAGGVIAANEGSPGTKEARAHWRSRGNNVFGFEDLPNN